MTSQTMDIMMIMSAAATATNKRGPLKWRDAPTEAELTYARRTS